MFALTQSEVARLLSGIDLNKTWGKRDYLIILLLCHTGMRIGEACRLTVYDVIDPATGQPREEIYLSARITKTRKGRAIPFNSTARKAVGKLLEFNRGLSFSTQPEAPLFPARNHGFLRPRSVQSMVQKLRQEVGMSDKVTPHVFRHTFATEVVDSGASLPTLKDILGHKYLTSTQVYTHTSTGKKKAATEGLFQRKRHSA